MVITNKLKLSLAIDAVILLIFLAFLLLKHDTSYLIFAIIYLAVSIVNTFRQFVKQESRNLPEINANIERLKQDSGES